MSNIYELTFYSTSSHACSYLDGKEASTIFVDPKTDLNGELYSQLSELGFRRSGRHVYRPNCETCQACVPIRVPVNTFTPSRSQTRCSKRNRDLTMHVVNTIDTDEHYQLYEHYINLRHQDGDMYPASKEQYRDFLTSEWGITEYIEFRDDNKKLIAVSVTDALVHGISAIYFFFDPEQDKRSLGTFNILHLIERAKQCQKPFVFLGYWIKACQKMSYKTKYQPFQVFVNNSWITVSDIDHKRSK